MKKIRFSQWNKSIPMYDDFQMAICNSITSDHLEKINILELGVGRGGTAITLLKKFKQAKYDGVDNDENAINIARKVLKKATSVNIIFQDIKNFSTDKKYNYVISALTLHHLNAKEKLKQVKIIKKWLKKDGVFIWGDIIRMENEQINQKAINFFKNYRESVLSNNEKQEILKHINNEPHIFQTISEIKKILKIAGFKKVDIVWAYYRLIVIRASF
jgi:tRNA (cmo5U34)-methyltransferase